MNDLKIGDCTALDISGARNTVYAVPACERDDGAPFAFVWSCVGAGTPEAAYHGRMLSLGNVPRRADADSVEQTLRMHADTIVEMLSRYLGSEHDGSNVVGRWAATGDGEPALPEDDDLTLALANVETVWNASDWYAPIASLDELLSCYDERLSLSEIVAGECDAAARENALLDPSDVEDWLVNEARDLLDAHDNVDDDELQAARRARLEAWTAC